VSVCWCVCVREANGRKRRREEKGREKSETEGRGDREAVRCIQILLCASSLGEREGNEG